MDWATFTMEVIMSVTNKIARWLVRKGLKSLKRGYCHLSIEDRAHVHKWLDDQLLCPGDNGSPPLPLAFIEPFPPDTPPRSSRRRHGPPVELP